MNQEKLTGFEVDEPKQQTNKVSPREIFLKYLPYFPWVLASVLLFSSIALIRLRYSPQIYSVSGTILVQETNPYGSKTEKFDAILFNEPDRNLYDEIQIIKSRNMARRVAKSLDLSVQYYNRGNVRSSLIYKRDSPISLSIVQLKDSSKSFSLSVTVLSDTEFSIGQDPKRYSFGQPIENSNGIFLVTRSNVDYRPFVNPDFVVNYTPSHLRAIEISNGLNVSQSGESSNILQLKFETENPKYGIDIINQLMKEYQHAGLEDKKQMAVNALGFIDDQMDTVRLELTGVERNLESYRVKNRIFDPVQQTEKYFQSLSEIEREATKQGANLENINFLIRSLSDLNAPYRQVASLLGIEEPTLLMQIQEFNKLQVQRQTLLKTTTEANPTVKGTETAIEKLRLDILQNLANVRQAQMLSLNSLKLRNLEMDKEVSSIPGKQKQLLDITRRQKILEELYSYLLQKKLETSISSASTISNVRVIEPASYSEQPVRPNKSSILTLAVLMGLLVPAAIIFLFEFFNDKIRSRDDIQKGTTAPILGEVGHAEDGKSIVVDKGSRKFISEQFRMIRSNLQYVLPKDKRQIFLVTSSTSGEGKSFISTNIAAVIALAGKKTAILELDIRKPKIMSSLKLTRATGITNYIIGEANVKDLPVSVPGIDNLYVIPCGPVPPNPAELLLSSKLEQLFTELQKDFDVLVIDSAPVGLVSDATLLSKFAEGILYIVRHNYTFKKQLHNFDDMYKSKRLKNVSLIINDIPSSQGYGNYYGYSAYGYNGYTYGYGSEYFEDARPKTSLMQRIVGIFRRH